MRLKSYFAASVAEAIENARIELGPEAMLLNSREISPEQRHLGAYEVVFGITGEPLLPRRSEAVAHLFSPPLVTPPPVTLAAKAAAPALAKASAPQPASTVTPAPPPEIPAWKRTLEELVSRQEAPVPLSSIPSPRATANPFTPPPKLAPAPKAEVRQTVTTPAPQRISPQAAVNAAPAPRNSAPHPVAATDSTRYAYKVNESAPSPEVIAGELANLRQQLERVTSSLAGSASQQTSFGRNRELEALNSQLVSLGFSPVFAQKMGEAAVERLSAFTAESATLSFASRSGYSLEHLQQVLVAELQSRFQVRPELGVAGSDRKTIMLVGPPGAGKTTTLVKLAVKYGLEKRVPVHLFSLDTVRVGGSEQLATFSRILNVSFDALHTTSALGEALADARADAIALIDCPGYAPADMEQASATAFFLRRNPNVDVQLVLPAFMNLSSLQSSTQRFAIFNPSKLLFTHLDEVDSLGAILEQTIKSGLPASFLTNGQGIPQDLLEASKDLFTQGILNGAVASGAA